MGQGVCRGHVSYRVTDCVSAPRTNIKAGRERRRQRLGPHPSELMSSRAIPDFLPPECEIYFGTNDLTFNFLYFFFGWDKSVLYVLTLVFFWNVKLFHLSHRKEKREVIRA